MSKEKFKEIIRDILMESDQDASEIIVDMVKEFPESFKLILKEIRILDKWKYQDSKWTRSILYGQGTMLSHRIILNRNDRSYQILTSNPHEFREFDTLDFAQDYLDHKFKALGWILS